MGFVVQTKIIQIEQDTSKLKYMRMAVTKQHEIDSWSLQESNKMSSIVFNNEQFYAIASMLETITTDIMMLAS